MFRKGRFIRITYYLIFSKCELNCRFLDELTSHSVKHGFINPPIISDEHGSAKNCNFNPSRFVSYFNGIVSKKADYNTVQDQGKRKPSINHKDIFYPVISRTKPTTDAWIKDLAGTKPFEKLGKKVPMFNKKEEVLIILCENKVPMLRACWFIKMANVYNTAQSDANKTKKRHPLFDPFMDWTNALTRYLKDQLTKIIEHYQGSMAQTSFLTAGATTVVDIELPMRNWNYCTNLAHYLYEEGLLDRHELLSWFLELLEKQKITDDTVLKLIFAQVLKYTSDYVESQLLSRKLAHYCSKKLYQFCNDSGCGPTHSPMVTQGSSSNQSSQTTPTPNRTGTSTPVPNQQSPIASLFAEYNGCPQHRGLILSLSSILQIITIRCPGALVWHNFGEGKSASVLTGSPLDLLPCAPSCLPMPPGVDNQPIRLQLRAAENQIAARGRAAEMRWSADKCPQTNSVIGRVLHVLEALDQHNFDRVEPNCSLDSLYHKVFGGKTSKDGSNVGDESVVNLLCEWAVSTQRTGEHRAIVVAKLLEKRQQEIGSEKFSDPDMVDERDSVASEIIGASGNNPFQGLLMNFLDKKAPLLDDNPTMENKHAFANLILLFCELIANEVFSHDAYICNLISRGDLMHYPAVQPSTTFPDLSSVKSESMKQEEMKQELESQVLDSGFDIFAPLKDEVKHSPEAPASVKSEQLSAATPGHPPTPMGHPGHTPSRGSLTPGPARTPGAPGTPAGSHTPGLAHTPGSTCPRLSHPPIPTSLGRDPCRHLVYVTHFPIPQDEMNSHECNQRMVLLYGVSKARDEARHNVKKITKEVMKLFSKKNCMEFSNGDTGKQKRKKEKELLESINYETIFNKFQRLTYYDQHALTSVVTNSIVESFSGFGAGTSFHLPPLENISFLLDLMEYCYNINGILVFIMMILKELPDVDAQLHKKSSVHAVTYSTHLSLSFVALLRKYHAYLLVSVETTCNMFESLCRVVKHVGNPSRCTSAERCILAYLYDVYTKCNFLKLSYMDLFGVVCSKVQNAVYAEVSPSPSNLLWDTGFMADTFHNPRMKVDTMMAKQINDNQNDRYNFVVNAVLNVCLAKTAERLNDVSLLCAEMTGYCSSLSSEWLGVLKALCWSSNFNCGYSDVTSHNDINDLSIHDNLAVFTAILVAHHCFTLENFVSHVALHSLLAACPSTGTGGDQAAERGARLTCHLLLRLFQSVHVHPGSSPETRKNILAIKSSCDRHLLEAAHSGIHIGAVVAVLKAILMLGDTCNSEHKSSRKDRNDDIITHMLSQLDDGMDDMSLSLMDGSNKSPGLSEYAKHCLKEICSQEWVQEKFLKNPENLFDSDLLLDNLLSHRQAQQLVQMICYPGGIPSVLPLDDDDEDEEPEEQRHITRILQNVDQWSLRVSWLELQLMLKQATNSQKMNALIENIAVSTIEVFQRQTERKNKMLDNAVASPANPWQEKESESAWLIAPLISKLSSSVQGKVLRTAGQVLETGNNFWSAKNSKDRERYLLKSTSLLGHQPFLSLVFACLQGQDEQREGLLKSLYDQLDKFVINTREQQASGLPTEDKLKFMMQEALQLRLSLVGGMFDTIQRTHNLRQDWAILLMQLVSHGVVDINNNSELFTIILDMLSILIHGTLVPDNSDKNEDSRKHYSQLIRKLKKELGEKHSASIDQCRQLLPLPKVVCEVIQCESFENDSESNRQKSNANPHDRKAEEGLRITSKQKVNPWDVIEGMKNLSPFSYSWFGAIRLERQPLLFEEEHQKLMYHNHQLKKPPSHFLDAPQLPAEDLEPIMPEKPGGFSFPHHSPILVDVLDQKHQPEKMGMKQKRGSRIRRQAPRIGTPTGHSPYMPGPMGPMGPFNRQEMYSSGPQGNWYPGQNPGPQQAPYMPPQHLPPGGPRFGPGASISSSSKMALSSYLRARNPNQGYMSQSPTQNYDNMRMMHQQQQQQRMIRHQLSMRNQRNMNRMTGDAGVYGQQMNMGPSGNFPAQNMPTQGFSGGYGQGMNMGASQQGGQGTFNQPYQNTSGGAMVRGMQGMAAGQQQQNQQNIGFMGNQGPQSQFPATSRFSNMEPGMSGMATASGAPNQQGSLSMSGGGLSQMPAGYTPQGGSGGAGYNVQGSGAMGAPNTAALSQQQRQLQQQRHQMMMQQQQMRPQAPMAAGQQQQMYPQMQRQMSGGNQSANPNFNPYQQQQY